ncbi:MAG: NUDIX hydrolase [Elusimicrobia bacterium]|nr:NUDIX hydrolase [Elusimicrobiota bacterium]
MEKFIKRLKLVRGNAVEFAIDKVKLPNGNFAEREYMKHPGAAVAVPVLPGDKIILVRQFRYPAGRFMLELPAGKIAKGETPLNCIKRELEEETGYKSGKFALLMRFYPTGAFSTEEIFVYAAGKLKETKMAPDEDEFIERIFINFDTALKMVLSGKIIDAKSIIAILLWEKLRKAKEFRKFSR